jgi:hypothetical protein
MSLKTLQDQFGRSLKMGRQRPTVTYAGHHLREYLKHDTLPTVPPTISYASDANAALSQIYLNATYGDCVIASTMHVEGVVTGNATQGNPIIFTDAQVEQAYGWCGFDPHNPTATDQGCEIQPVLKKWIAQGFPGHGGKAAGYLAVDPTNRQEIQTAIYLFENLIFGMELPDAWVNTMPNDSGFVWDVAGNPDPNNGHCICGFGYTSQGVNIDSWGLQGIITYGAISEYCAGSNNGELYVLITKDILNAASSLSPDGLDWDQLIADFDALGGTLPVSPNPPTPSPTPTPTPPPAPTHSSIPLPVGACGIVVKHHGETWIDSLPHFATGIAIKT